VAAVAIAAASVAVVVGPAAAERAVAGSRYRSEAGVPCIDVRARRIEHIFDNRDPAPFRQRDLDPDLAQYLVDAGGELASHAELAIVFWLEHPADQAELVHAFRGHFEDAIARMERRRRRSRRIGAVTLLLGIVLVVVLFTLAQLIGAAIPGSLGAALREGLVISSWVVLWRPVEILIYGWIPARQERRDIERLLAARVSIRSGEPPKEAYPS
jgi:hypothetical protein